VSYIIFYGQKKSDDIFYEFLDPPGLEVGAFLNLTDEPRRATNIAFETREKFVNYFNSENLYFFLIKQYVCKIIFFINNNLLIYMLFITCSIIHAFDDTNSYYFKKHVDLICQNFFHLG